MLELLKTRGPGYLTSRLTSHPTTSYSRSRIAKVTLLVAAMHQFGHIVLAVVFHSSVVFNSNGFCNSPKASEASKKTLNLPFSIPQWGAGFPSISDPFFVICLALFLAFFRIYLRHFLGFICDPFCDLFAPFFGLLVSFMGHLSSVIGSGSGHLDEFMVPPLMAVGSCSRL
jgi:hypothetical protein